MKILDEIVPNYSYIFGCYLGDGHITEHERTNKLTLYSDIKHQDIIINQKFSLKLLFPNNKINEYIIKNCARISVYNKNILTLFPQHGKGLKSDRQIKLENWQKEIISKEPECFIKGLIDTDGSYYTQSQIIKGIVYKYDMFSFTNKSSDIKNLYVETLSKLNIAVKQRKNKKNIWDCYVRKKNDVSLLNKYYEIAENKLTPQ